MKLLERLKTTRACQKAKKPLPETVFPAVAAIVQKFGLTSVLELDAVGDRPVASHPSGRGSLFPLLSQVQYRLTRDIIARFDNPYLIHARTPADIALSLRLYRRQPDLAPATLQHYPLSELWSGEVNPVAGPAANSLAPEKAE